MTRKIPLHDGSLATRHGPSGPWTFEYGEPRGNRFFTDENGAFVQDVDYQPFGKPASTGAEPGSQLYSSKQWNCGDSLAAFGVSQLGARLYDPAIGRFVSRDPLLTAASNPYAFADNDPVNLSDPTGLAPQGCSPDGLCITRGMGEAPSERTPSSEYSYGHSGAAGEYEWNSGQYVWYPRRHRGHAPIKRHRPDAAAAVSSRMAVTSEYSQSSMSADVNWLWEHDKAIVRGASNAIDGFLDGLIDHIATAMEDPLEFLQVSVDPGLLLFNMIKGQGVWLGVSAARIVTDIQAGDSVRFTETLSEIGTIIVIGAVLGRAAGPNRIYSARVLLREAAEPGPLHNFPGMFDQQIFQYGTRTVTSNFWKVARAGYSNDSIMYRLPGSWRGVQGVYEIGVRPSLSGRTELIMHRFFRPNP